jgi:hypothetical protein
MSINSVYAFLWENQVKDKTSDVFMPKIRHQTIKKRIKDGKTHDICKIYTIKIEKTCKYSRNNV